MEKGIKGIDFPVEMWYNLDKLNRTSGSTADRGDLISSIGACFFCFLRNAKEADT